MAVQKHPSWKTYRYDFQCRRRRFSGDTFETTKRAAKEVERQIKAEVKERLRNQPKKAGGPVTFKQAADRWHDEVGRHHANEKTTLRDLLRLQERIGTNTMLHEITDETVADLVAKRRGDRAWNRKDKGFVKPATVNRSVTMRLRDIVIRARKVWKVQTPDIDFGQHMLPEPQERVREGSIVEEDTALSKLTPGYAEATRFAFETGCRRMEILGMEWSRVDFFSDRFEVTGKYGKRRFLPMTESVRALLWDQQGFHPRKVWTYEAQRTDKRRGIVRGQHYPLTEAGFKTAFRRAVARAGIEDFRFHDTRHTAATRILRESNLRVVQNILGHSDPKTTAKYAHAMDNDLKNAMQAASVTRGPIKSPIDNSEKHAKMMKGNKKRD